MPLSFEKFILFGDSITEFSNNQAGFALAPALQHLYSRKLDIVTRGLSGYNTDQGLVLLPEILKADNAAKLVRIMYIFMGTNDAATTFQGVPLARYRSNLTKMVQLAGSQGIQVIVVGPALHDQTLCTEVRKLDGDKDSEPFSSNAATREYADTAKEVAAENKVPFVDLWTEFQTYGGWSTEELLANKPDLSELLVDGIHYSPRAYEIFYDALVETIVEHCPEYASSSIRNKFPYYRDVDYGNIEKSLMDYIEQRD